MEPVCLSSCTLLHPESKPKVSTFFSKVYDALEEEGKFIITFRDLSDELLELDRFIPLKSYENLIFTCFLEYEKDTVKVHDILYRKVEDILIFSASFYRKLRLSKELVEEQLASTGFIHIESKVDGGAVSVIATK